MNKILKFPWETRHKHFFTSDLHVFHDPSWDVPIWKSRGYSSAADAVRRILDEINKKVKEDDTLWILGDLFLNATDEQCINWLNQIICKDIKKIWGNHHSNTYRMYKQTLINQFGTDEFEVYPLKIENTNLTVYGNHLEIQVGKKRIVFNHFPLRIWNGSHRGAWHLSGHSHLNDPMRNPSYPVGKCFDVGWDYKTSVWSFEEIEDVMSTKTVELIDHHDHSTN